MLLDSGTTAYMDVHAPAKARLRDVENCRWWLRDRPLAFFFLIASHAQQRLPIEPLSNLLPQGPPLVDLDLAVVGQRYSGTFERPRRRSTASLTGAASLSCRRREDTPGDRRLRAGWRLKRFFSLQSRATDTRVLGRRVWWRQYWPPGVRPDEVASPQLGSWHADNRRRVRETRRSGRQDFRE